MVRNLDNIYEVKYSNLIITDIPNKDSQLQVYYEIRLLKSFEVRIT